MDILSHFMTLPALFAGLKAMIAAWLITEAIKRLIRNFSPSNECPDKVTRIISAVLGIGFAYWLHSQLEETINPTAFFALTTGLLTPILHHIMAIQGLGIVEDLISKRLGVQIDLRAAITGSGNYKHANKNSEDDDDKQN